MYLTSTLLLILTLFGMGTSLRSHPYQDKSLTSSTTQLWQYGSDRRYVGEDLKKPDVGKPLLVIGATGRVGRAVVSKLKAQHLNVRCLVRDKSRALTMPELQDTTLILGTTDNLDSLVEASSGCDVIIDVHGMRPPRFTKLIDLFRHPQHDNTHPYNVNYLGTKRVIAAMKINNAKKLVRITGSQVGKSPYSFPMWLFDLLLSLSPKWHERSEIAIREADIDYTVIRPTGIAEEPPARESGRSLILLAGDSGQSAPLPGKISIDDLSDIVVKSATIPNFFTKASAIVSSVNGTAGSQEWEPLLPQIVRDYKSIPRQKHELAVALYAGIILPAVGFFLAVVARNVFKAAIFCLLKGFTYFKLKLS